MPVAVRKWWIDRVNLQIKKEAEEREKTEKNSKR